MCDEAQGSSICGEAPPANISSLSPTSGVSILGTEKDNGPPVSETDPNTGDDPGELPDFVGDGGKASAVANFWIWCMTPVESKCPDNAAVGWEDWHSQQANAGNY